MGEGEWERSQGGREKEKRKNSTYVVKQVPE
jgi:hypothetical protein